MPIYLFIYYFIRFFFHFDFAIHLLRYLLSAQWISMYVPLACWFIGVRVCVCGVCLYVRDVMWYCYYYRCNCCCCFVFVSLHQFVELFCSCFYLMIAATVVVVAVIGIDAIARHYTLTIYNGWLWIAQANSSDWPNTMCTIVCACCCAASLFSFFFLYCYAHNFWMNIRPLCQ